MILSTGRMQCREPRVWSHPDTQKAGHQIQSCPHVSNKDTQSVQSRLWAAANFVLSAPFCFSTLVAALWLSTGSQSWLNKKRDRPWAAAVERNLLQTSLVSCCPCDTREAITKLLLLMKSQTTRSGAWWTIQTSSKFNGHSQQDQRRSSKRGARLLTAGASMETFSLRCNVLEQMGTNQWEHWSVALSYHYWVTQISWLSFNHAIVV